MSGMRSQDRVPAVFLAGPFRRDRRWLKPRPKLLTALPAVQPVALKKLPRIQDQENDLRFWSIYPPSGYSVCRCCSIIRWSHEERVAHKLTHPCTKKLVMAYKLLRLDGLCVVCDRSTTNAKYGVPLCKAHVEDFERKSDWPPIQEALKLVRGVV